MIRRRVAAGVGVVVLIVIAVLIAGAVSGHDEQSLKRYNQRVGRLIEESDQQVGRPLFAALSSATGQSPLDVESQIDQLRVRAQSQAARANRLTAPGGMEAAQRAFSLAMGLRAEGLTKIASLVRTVLGSGEAQQASTFIAGAMETFLASEVVYSQRVAPLIQQTLALNGIHSEQTTGTRFLADTGWLAPGTVMTRLTGRTPSTTPNGQLAPGTHGSKLGGVSVGEVTLEASPSLNHVATGPNPTFTVMVENSGENSETNVKVQVTVEAKGKQLKASHTIGETVPGKTVGAEVTVKGVPLESDTRVTADIEPVRGETNKANNKATYLAVFSK